MKIKIKLSKFSYPRFYIDKFQDLECARCPFNGQLLLFFSLFKPCAMRKTVVGDIAIAVIRCTTIVII